MDQLLLTDVTKNWLVGVAIWVFTVPALSFAQLFTERRYTRVSKEIKTNLETYKRGLAVLGIFLTMVVISIIIGYVAGNLANLIFDVSESAVMWAIATLMFPHSLGTSLQWKGTNNSGPPQN